MDIQVHRGASLLKVTKSHTKSHTTYINLTKSVSNLSKMSNTVSMFKQYIIFLEHIKGQVYIHTYMHHMHTIGIHITLYNVHVKRWLVSFGNLSAVCPRILDHFHIKIIYRKMDRNSWTYSMLTFYNVHLKRKV